MADTTGSIAPMLCLSVALGDADRRQVEALCAEVVRLRDGLREIAGTYGVTGANYFRNRAQSILNGDPHA